MFIYDTLSGEKKELTFTNNQSLKMFVCGPTVYDYPHIGNARTFVFFDMFARYLRSHGMTVNYLQNITDIDDKIIQRARDENTSWQAISKKYETIYFANLKSLGVDTEHMQFARATEYIPEIMAQVKRLIAKGCAYKIDDPDASVGAGGWYFDLTTYPEYGQLARRTVAQAEDGVTRVDNSDKKRNAGDFCLWKLTTDDRQLTTEPSWPSEELGAGKPGWHIEDTAITEKFFGPQYDIHGGAVDLKFPHHEAERAQQESASGKKPFVNIWMHAGFLTINGTKMSKSLGNFMTVDDLLKKMSAEEFRMMILMSHYRSPLDFTEKLIHDAKANIAYFRKLVALGDEKKESAEKFTDAMNDDFNTPKALAVLFEMKNSALIKESLASLGINLDFTIPANVRDLFGKYKLSRASKQFANSDALRKELEELGYIVEDGTAGSLILPKSS